MKKLIKIAKQLKATSFNRSMTCGLGGFQFALVCTLLVALIAIAPEAKGAGKIEASFGFYSLSAKTNKKSGAASNFGLYRAAYNYTVGSQFELNLGYSIFMSNIIGGDLGFGPDLGLLYFPVTDPGTRVVQTPKLSLRLDDVLRPFVGVGFHQRQFQSVDSSYAGFSFCGGAEYNYSENLGIKATARYQILNGPSSASASQLDVLLGLLFSL